MNITKVKKSYNDYEVSLSFGQLDAIRAALEKDHSDPLSDELLAELIWYLDRVPGPGEDEDELKAEQEQAQNGGKEGAVEGEDVPVAMPPGSEAGTPPGSGEAPLGYPPEEGGTQEPEGLKILKGEEAPHSGRGLPEPGMEGGEGVQPGQPPEEDGGVDHKLPPPPRE